MALDNEQQSKLNSTDDRKGFGLSNVTTFLMKLKRIWGMIFRFLFITWLGIAGYFWFDPQPLSDIPFSQLTLKMISKNLFAGGFAIFCIKWFLTFPFDEEDPYNMWANFSGFLVVLGIIWWNII